MVYIYYIRTLEEPQEAKKGLLSDEELSLAGVFTVMGELTVGFSL